MPPSGFRLIEVEATTSTNTACLEAAQSGDPGNLWIRAERQSSGRGSRGRSWESLPGNLFASLLLVDPGPTASLANLTFVAALGVHDGLGRLAAAHGIAPDITLKWPNDVLINGRKVSGILLEHHMVGRRAAVIIGIGVNCAGHPGATTHAATDLAAEGMPAPPRDVLELTAQAIAGWLGRWGRGTGFPDIRRAWLARASALGRPIVARLPSGDVAGIFEDLDAQGQLVLRRPDGRAVTIAAADIFFDAGGLVGA
ncbi:MAG: biotin--[acetyl-CoA-carboxylase] ligase [Alphaproteobacteria bacterium]|nr:MAG: biotin--[acetyl-CoA-carboxylase] ligase [Alphaproteobacteria bacterium]